MPQKPRLKACPFCGVKPLVNILRRHKTPSYKIYCANSLKCEVGAETQYYPTLEDAAKVWNRRTK